MRDVVAWRRHSPLSALWLRLPRAMRPTRSSILDNLSPEQQVLWDCFLSESGGTAKLTARRSRRRPGDWAPRANAPMVRGVSYELLCRIDASNDDEISWFEGEYGFPHTNWRHDWKSPAQRGREMGRQRKRSRPDRLTLQTAHGAVEVFAHPMCGNDTFIMMSERNSHSVSFDGRPSFAQLQKAADDIVAMSGAAPTRAILNLRDMSSLNKQAAALRGYG